MKKISYDIIKTNGIGLFENFLFLIGRRRLSIVVWRNFGSEAPAFSFGFSSGLNK